MSSNKQGSKKGTQKSTNTDKTKDKSTTDSNVPNRNSVPNKILEDQRTKVRVGNAGVENTRGVYYSGAYTSLGFDNSFSLEKFKNDFKINILSDKPDHLVFEMIGVDAPIANALRRIMIAEVPTMAIEKVYILNNTSVIQDEVLAHRLGLIPIKVDPRKFNYKIANKDYTSDDTLIFTLKVRCYIETTGEIVNSTVFSGQLKWQPTEEQEETFADPEDRPRPVHNDIPIAKLRPGQEIDIQCYCDKNIGREHIKWSPVGTASYRLQPLITVDNSLLDQAQKEKLKNTCPKNVYDIEDSDVFAARPLDCTMCRECIREPEFDKAVKLERIRNHFIYSIEAIGMLSPKEIFQEAIKILIEKCEIVEQSLKGVPVATA